MTERMFYHDTKTDANYVDGGPTYNGHIFANTKTGKVMVVDSVYMNKYMFEANTYTKNKIDSKQ